MITVRENNTNYDVIVEIPVNVPFDPQGDWDNQGGTNTEYFANKGPYCNDPNHLTKTSNPGKKFDHLHIHITFPIEGYYINFWGTKVTKEVNEDNVKAYWDWWYAAEAKRRTNVQSHTSGFSVANPTYNCWGFSFGNDTWVQNPQPIYSDDYTKVANQNFPHSGDVIKLSDHVITVGPYIDYGESSNPILETQEKNQFSGIYFFRYNNPGAKLGGEFHRKK